MAFSRMLKIAIFADPLSAGLIASLVAARLPKTTCNIDLFINEKIETPSEIYARPNIRHVHQLLQITEAELMRFAEARMVLSLPANSYKAGDFQLPLGDYGYPIKGCAFQHYWFRAFSANKAKDFEHYNFALRLSESDIIYGEAPAHCPKISPGYVFNGEAYAKLLLSKAREMGSLELKSGNMQLKHLSDEHTQVRIDEDINEYDLIFNVDGGLEELGRNGWVGNYVSIQPERSHEGLFLYQIQSALERIFNIWSQSSDNRIECQEYNRLLEAETEHIQDMKQLLAGPLSDETEGQLSRKINLFEVMGRIPFEDYDLFSRAEWMAAMRSVGIKALGYNRLADRLSLDEIANHLAQLDETMSKQIKVKCQA